MQTDIYNSRLGLLREKLSILPDKTEETPDNTLKALWSTAAGNPVSVIQANDIVPTVLSDSQIKTLDELLAKRIQGIPLAYLTGRQSFMGLVMLTRNDALIPRKETEILATTAIAIANKYLPATITVIDTCTGAGNIALAIASHCPHAHVLASDLSEQAAILARENAEHLGLAARVTFFSGDLLAPFNTPDLQGKVSLLTCNPPYISSAKVTDMPAEISSHEPRLAFDGGAFGINLIKRLVSEADSLLSATGTLVFEVGFGQAVMIKKLVEKTGLYTQVDTVNDTAGHPRVIIARKSRI